MYDGIDFQTMMFERLFIATKQHILENKGFLKPVVEVFWRDGRRSAIEMTEEDSQIALESYNMIVQFIADLDLFCSKEEVYVVYACFPLDEPHCYCCILTGLEWKGQGLCRAIYYDANANSVGDVDHDLSKYENIFEEVRFNAMFYNTKTGRA